jgi:hypothetical protein
MSDPDTDARIDARSDAGHDAGTDARFGGLTASEAAQRRWTRERARQASADARDADAIPTDAEIIAALRRKAERGDAAAARELREWRTTEAALTQGDAWMAVLTEEQRGLLRGWIEDGLARAGHPVTPDR